MQSGYQALLCGLTALAAPCPARILSVVDFGGAAGDGKTLDTEAIQGTLDAAGPGDEVLFPGSRGGAELAYLTGALRVSRSHIQVRFEDGARIQGTANPSDYPLLPPPPSWGGSYSCQAEWIWGGPIHAPLFHILGASNVSVTGNGTIDGHGESWWRQCFELRTLRQQRPWCLMVENSTDVYVGDGLRVRNAAFWSVHLLYSNRVHVRGIDVWCTPSNDNCRGTCNCDGINSNSVSNVLVENSVVAVRDNTLTIKSGQDWFGREYARPAENITYRNITLLRGGAIALGSETSGGARNITFEDIKYHHVKTSQHTVDPAVTLKTRRGRGGVVEDVVFRNLDLRGVEHVFGLDEWYFCKRSDVNCSQTNATATPIYRNITLENVVAYTRQYLQTGKPDTVIGSFNGLPEAPPALRMQNVTVNNGKGLWSPCANMTMHAEGVLPPVPKRCEVHAVADLEEKRTEAKHGRRSPRSGEEQPGRLQRKQ